jgi:hypothetical protein
MTSLPHHVLSWRSWRFRAGVALVLAAVGLRLLWGGYVERKLRAQHDQLRQDGFPILPQDVSFEAVPASEDASALLTQAGNASKSFESPRCSNDNYRDSPPYPPFWMNRVVHSEKANAQAFVLIRQMRDRSKIRFNGRLTSPIYSTVLALPLSDLRNLANVVTDGAIYAHLQGRDVESIERIRDVLHEGNLVRQDSFLVSQLVASGVDALAFVTAQIVAPGLNLKDETSRAHARALIAELLDEGPTWQRFEASVRFERLGMADYLAHRSRGNWVVTPLAEMEEFRSNQDFIYFVQASHYRDQPPSARVLSHARPDETNRLSIFSGSPSPRSIPRYSRWFGQASNGLSRAFGVQFRVVAERRATAVSLAVQLFRADHGRFPQRLDELVPAYLPAMPADPFHDDGRPLGYVIKAGALPGGGDRPMITYDAGPDDPSAMSGEPMYSFHQGTGSRVFRQYRDLTRFEPKSPKAVNHDPGESDGPGDEAEKKDPPEHP